MGQGFPLLLLVQLVKAALRDVVGEALEDHRVLRQEGRVSCVRRRLGLRRRSGARGIRMPITVSAFP